MNPRTNDRRAAAVQRAHQVQVERQYRKDAIHLLQDPAFHRWLATEWYAFLGLGSDPCRSSAFEAQRASARVGVAVEQRKRLLLLDRQGVKAIDDANHDRIATEMDLDEAVEQQPTEEEHTDA